MREGKRERERNRSRESQERDSGREEGSVIRPSAVHDKTVEVS